MLQALAPDCRRGLVLQVVARHLTCAAATPVAAAPAFPSEAAESSQLGFRPGRVLEQFFPRVGDGTVTFRHPTEADAAQFQRMHHTLRDEKVYARRLTFPSEQLGTAADYLRTVIDCCQAPADPMAAAGNADYIVVEHEGQLVGEGFLSFPKLDHPLAGGPPFLVLGICLIERATSLGIGKRLMLLLEQRALQLGVRTLNLAVWAANSRAVHVYQTLGYIKVKDTELGLEGGNHGHLFQMVKTLRSDVTNPLNSNPRLWDDLGFCTFPGLFSTDEVAEMRAHYSTTTTQGDEFQNPSYPLAEPHTREAFWFELCRSPKLLDAIESLIGPDIVLVFSSFFTKAADGLMSTGPSKDKNGADVAKREQQLATVSFHQDNMYWTAVHGTDGVITVWIALDDADASK